MPAKDDTVAKCPLANYVRAALDDLARRRFRPARHDERQAEQFFGQSGNMLRDGRLLGVVHFRLRRVRHRLRRAQIDERAHRARAVLDALDFRGLAQVLGDERLMRRLISHVALVGQAIVHLVLDVDQARGVTHAPETIRNVRHVDDGRSPDTVHAFKRAVPWHGRNTVVHDDAELGFRPVLQIHHLGLALARLDPVAVLGILSRNQVADQALAQPPHIIEIVGRFDHLRLKADQAGPVLQVPRMRLCCHFERPTTQNLHHQPCAHEQRGGLGLVQDARDDLLVFIAHRLVLVVIRREQDGDRRHVRARRHAKQHVAVRLGKDLDQRHPDWILGLFFAQVVGELVDGFQDFLGREGVAPLARFLAAGGPAGLVVYILSVFRVD